MKRIIIAGNIGRDAVCREGNGGHKFVTFSVACDERQKKDDAGNTVKETIWAECEIYVSPEKSADNLVKALSKGRHIYLEAYDRADTWLNKEGEACARIIYRVLSFDI